MTQAAGLLALLATLASAGLLALRLCGGSVGTLLLGTYVVWLAQVVGLALVLSPLDALGRTGYLLGAVALLGGTVMWQALRPAAAPPVASRLRAVAAAVRADRVLGALALVVAVELAYATALALLTPPADDDSLQYHLGRVAFWLQQGHVGPLGDGFDFRLDAWPVNAELAYAFLLALWGGDGIVALVNVLAAVALTTAVGVGARRLGLGLREATFGALLAASLPVVALQAPSTLTDLQVAALVTTAAALLLRARGGDLALAALAAGIAVGAKVTGIFAVPILALIAWGAWRPRRAIALSALAGGIAVGAYWYGWNLLRTGAPLGETSADQRASTDPLVALAQTMRFAVNLLDLPGAVGHDVFVYPLAAIALVVAAVLVATALRRPAGRRDLLLAAALVAAVPLLATLGEVLQWVYRGFWRSLGRDDLSNLDGDRVETFASSMQSGAGPVGVLLLVAGTIVTARAVRRRELAPRALLFALAPLAWVVMIGVVVAYFRWSARFALPGFALAAMTWGLVLRTRWLAVAATTIAGVTVLLSLVHFYEKPAGIRLLEPRTERSAFTTPRVETMAWDPRVVALLRAVDEDLPRAADVAVFPVFYPRRPDLQPEDAPELLVYPVFGRSLSRTVRLALDPAAAAASGATWYLVPTARLAGCVAGWAPVEERSSWTILRRAPGRACG